MARPRKPASQKKGRSESTVKLNERAEQEKRLMGTADQVKMIPEYLDPIAKAYYAFIVKEMDEINLLSNLDIPLLEQTATCLSELKQLDDTLKGQKIIIEVKDRYNNMVKKEHPAWTAKQKLLKEFRALTNLLPMNPNSRAQLAGLKVEAKEESEDELLQILKGD